MPESSLKTVPQKMARLLFRTSASAHQPNRLPSFSWRNLELRIGGNSGRGFLRLTHAPIFPISHSTKPNISLHLHHLRDRFIFRGREILLAQFLALESCALARKSFGRRREPRCSAQKGGLRFAAIFSKLGSRSTREGIAVVKATFAGTLGIRADLFENLSWSNALRSSDPPNWPALGYLHFKQVLGYLDQSA